MKIHVKYGIPIAILTGITGAVAAPLYVAMTDKNLPSHVVYLPEGCHAFQGSEFHQSGDGLTMTPYSAVVVCMSDMKVEVDLRGNVIRVTPPAKK